MSGQALLPCMPCSCSAPTHMGSLGYSSWAVRPRPFLAWCPQPIATTRLPTHTYGHGPMHAPKRTHAHRCLCQPKRSLCTDRLRSAASTHARPPGQTCLPHNAEAANGPPVRQPWRQSCGHHRCCCRRRRRRLVKAEAQRKQVPRGRVRGQRCPARRALACGSVCCRCWRPACNMLLHRCRVPRQQLLVVPVQHVGDGRRRGVGEGGRPRRHLRRRRSRLLALQPPRRGQVGWWVGGCQGRARRRGDDARSAGGGGRRRQVAAVWCRGGCGVAAV